MVLSVCLEHRLLPDNAHSLLLAFDRDDVAFVDGFELGRLWSELRAAPTEVVSAEIHARNVEMVLRLAEATGRDVQSEELGADWVQVTYGPAGVLESP
jgi:hypothetical protein